MSEESGVVSDTRFKLQEAEYFFNQMKKIAAEDNMTEFIFNLIAFVSAGRSVTFVMQDEYKRKVGPFAKWYCKNVDEALRKEELPKFFRDLRNVLLKQKGNPREIIYFPVYSTLTIRYNIEGSVTGKEEEKDSEETNPERHTPPSQQRQPVLPTITDNPDAQHIDQKYRWDVPAINDKKNVSRRYVISTCDEYLQRLRGIVSECERLIR